MGRSISGSVGLGGVNRHADVKTIQSLLNDNLIKIVPLAPVPETGNIGPHTIFAIETYQRRVVGMSNPDGRVDPNGGTLRSLNEAIVSQPVQPVQPGTGTTYTVTIQHGGKVPASAVGGTKTTNDLYESTLTISGAANGTFRASFWPDDITQRGRLKDGSYDLYIGFHKRAGSTPSKSNLVVKKNGFRAALIVNKDLSVPVHSDKAGKTTSSSIHVHNGFNTKRYSDGCPTLHPDDWARFIQVFLTAYPNLSDWVSTNAYVGRKIGQLVIKV